MTLPPERALRHASAGSAVVLLDRGDDSVLADAAHAVRACGADGPVTVVCDPARAERVGEVLPGASAQPVPGGPEALRVLAAAASSTPGRALVVLDVGCVVSPVAMLDLLDHPGRRTAAWVALGARAGAVWPAVRCTPSKSSWVESVAADGFSATGANAVALGLLRVDGSDLAEAARLWREAADRLAARRAPEGTAGGGTDGPPFATALRSLTRGGLPVVAVELSGWDVAAAAGPEEVAAARAAAGARPDDWRRRLVHAKRPVDGFYSTFAVRSISRRLTWRLLPTGVAPNTVTVVSFTIGLLAAVACGIGGWPMLVLAAVLLQVSLVLDCVDGEIARYTRRFSPLGAWLDVTGDRIKEYGVFAGLAVSSARHGRDVWWAALLALALVAYRHFVDYGHGVMVRADHRPQVSLGPVDQPDTVRPVPAPAEDPDTEEADPRPDSPQGRLAGLIAVTDASSTRALVHWVKKAIHMPIGERYLVISVTLLTGRPLVVLLALVVLEVLSALYTTPGRLLRSVAGD